MPEPNLPPTSMLSSAAQPLRGAESPLQADCVNAPEAARSSTPARSSPAPDSPAETAAAAVAADSERILIVDDEEAVLDSLSQLLSTKSYDCQAALDGKTALELIESGMHESRPFSLVLLDINMPGLSGIEVLAEIRQLCPELMVIMTTGVKELDVAVEAMKKGAKDYILKPLNRDELLIAIGNALELRKLLLQRRQHQQQMEEKLEEQARTIRNQVVEAMQALVEALEAKDPSYAGHSRRVAQLAAKIGRSLGLGSEDIERLQISAFLHDIGKIGTSERILQKQGPLSGDEWEHILSHVLQGVEIVRPLVKDPLVLGAIRHHHERFDGSGFPDGLKGERIPLLARIVAIADAYDAMVSPRTYRPAFPAQEAIAELQKESGSKFDPKLVQILVANVV